MKRDYNSALENEDPGVWIKKQRISPDAPIPQNRYVLAPAPTLKRGFENEEPNLSKKQRCDNFERLPENVVRYLAFGQKPADLPEVAIRQLQEEAEKQSENYRNLALTIYHGPSAKEEESENELENLGPISYALPPLAGSATMVQQPSCMEDEHPLSYQEQMQRTGMIGVPPPSNDDSYWTM